MLRMQKFEEIRQNLARFFTQTHFSQNRRYRFFSTKMMQGSQNLVLRYLYMGSRIVMDRFLIFLKILGIVSEILDILDVSYQILDIYSRKGLDQ